MDIAAQPTWNNPMRITCLHTASSNIRVFDAAAERLGIAPNVLQHEVRADLLAAAEQAGGLTVDIANATASALRLLSLEADAVVLTCSTLGPVVDGLSPGAAILRTDQALAFAAAQAGGNIAVLCAVETTLEPTTRLFQQAAQFTSASVDVQWVPGAWALFKAGDLDGYLAVIANAADRAYRDGASTVALAQASMSGAAARVTAGPPPLNSPTAGLSAALQTILKGR
ncbi:aspartate/glutamate racemase family protein [Pseudomonas sp. HT11]|uniref:aspartate/glutamate racemase family protein n=1 Tax=Pseudomonas sp. HT11 TaxID=3230490 RepID=UPI00384F6E52